MREPIVRAAVHQRKGYYKSLFKIAALWNWATAAALFLAYDWLLKIVGMPPMVHPVSLHLFCVTVFALGMGYWAVAKDPARNIDIVLIGIIAKVLVFLVLLYYWVLGDIPLLVFLPGIVDFVFALLFAEYVSQVRPERDDSSQPR